MFELKKILSSLVYIPGIFILAFLSAAVFRLKGATAVIFNLACALALYLFSIYPVANLITGSVESTCPGKSVMEADAIVVMGGGIIEGVQDLDGDHVLGAESLVRVVDAVRLYRLHQVPVLYSGGAVEGRMPEAPVAARYLKALGVSPAHILLEGKSRDTLENVRNVKKIIEEKKFKKILVVTSAYHMKRTSLLFRRADVNFSCYPSGGMHANRTYALLDFVPSIFELKKSAQAIKELFALMFYGLKADALK